MTTIDPTSSTVAGATTQAVKKSLGKDDFLALLVAQLQHQDPTQPTDNSQWMAQLAQFSSLEQLTNLGSQLTALTASQKVGDAVALLGRSVTYTAPDGSSAGGTVSSVEVGDGTVVVRVDGTPVDPASLLTIG